MGSTESTVREATFNLPFCGSFEEGNQSNKEQGVNELKDLTDTNGEVKLTIVNSCKEYSPPGYGYDEPDPYYLHKSNDRAIKEMCEKTKKAEINVEKVIMIETKVGDQKSLPAKEFWPKFKRCAEISSLHYQMVRGRFQYDNPYGNSRALLVRCFKSPWKYELQFIDKY